MKYLWLVLIPIDLLIFAASFYATREGWAYHICRNTFGLCDYQFVLGIAVVAWIGLFLAARELEP